MRGMPTARDLLLRRQGRARSAAIQRVSAASERQRAGPIGGWNTRDDPSSMPHQDAVVLDNWLPGVGKLEVRKGHTEYADTVGSADVETLFEYSAGATEKFLAACADSFYDVSAGGTATLVKSGLINARWTGVNFNAWALFVNGAANPQIYDGSTMSDAGFTGSGLTVSNLIGVAVFKHRLYFWEANSQDFWYGAVNAITGTLTKFPLSRVSKLGGKLVAIATWTRDGGSGPDDYFVAIMSSGDVIIYQGADPGDATDWALVGIYKMPRPLHQRGVIEIGDDVLIMTDQDFISMSDSLRTREVKLKLTKLSGAAGTAARAYKDHFGWQAVHYSGGNFVLFNIPIATNTEYHQYGFNTVTKAAFRFKDLNARCWGVYKGKLYFGGAGGFVYRADDGNDDNGADITAVAQCAWDDMGVPGSKIWRNVRPVMDVAGILTLTVKMGFDFGEPAEIEYTTTFTAQGAQWDAATSLWDETDWASESYFRNKWLGAGGRGRHISVTYELTSGGFDISWNRQDYRYQRIAGL